MPNPTNAIERLADALKAGGKTRGKKTPSYRPDGTLYAYNREHVMVEAGDVLEACMLATDQNDLVIQSQTKGCKGLPPATKVVLYADDVFRIVELAKPVKPSEPEAKPVK